MLGGAGNVSSGVPGSGDSSPGRMRCSSASGKNTLGQMVATAGRRRAEARSGGVKAKRRCIEITYDNARSRAPKDRRDCVARQSSTLVVLGVGVSGWFHR